VKESNKKKNAPLATSDGQLENRKNKIIIRIIIITADNEQKDIIS
jgi:hypothetical protein